MSFDVPAERYNAFMGGFSEPLADVFVELEELSPLIARQHAPRQPGSGQHHHASPAPAPAPAAAPADTAEDRGGR